MAVAFTSGRGSRLLVGAAALTVGLAAGRFVTYEPSPSERVSIASPFAGGGAAGTEGLEQAVRDDPADVTSWQALGAAYLRRAIESGNPSFYDLADRALAEAVALVPDDGDTVLIQGQLALSRHQFGEALVLGERAAARMPRSADALLVVVDAEVELGQYDDAAATLQEALDLKPALAALSRASYLRELRGDVAGALVVMQQAQVAGGAAFDRAVVTALIGDLHLRSGDADAAMTAYDEALQVSPGLAAAQIGRARTLAATDRLGDAITLLEEVVAAVPTAGPAQLLGDLRVLAGDAGGAEEAYAVVRAAAALQEASGGVADLEMALFEADHGHPAIALERARRVHGTRPTVYAADAVAWALYRSGRAAEAMPYVEEALRLGTADPMLRLHAAAVLAHAGASDRASQQLRLAFSGVPWFLPPDDGLVAALGADLGVDVPAAWAAWTGGAAS